MVGQRRLGDVEAEGAAAAGLAAIGERGDDAEPLRVAQRVQDRRQVEIGASWVMEVHESSSQAMFDGRLTI